MKSVWTEYLTVFLQNNYGAYPYYEHRTLTTTKNEQKTANSALQILMERSFIHFSFTFENDDDDVGR